MSKKSRRVAKARRMLFTLSLVLVVAMAAVGGTLAWLTSQTDPVTNTFTATDITVTLEETYKPTGVDGNGNPLTLGTNEAWEAPLLPGMTYNKNPKVTIVNSTDAYLYVKFDETDTNNALEFTSLLNSTNGWTQLDTTKYPNIWWRRVDKGDTTKEWYLIDQNKVSVPSTVVASQTGADATLTYQAWAIQANALVDKNADSAIDAVDGWLLLTNP